MAPTPEDPDPSAESEGLPVPRSGTSSEEPVVSAESEGADGENASGVLDPYLRTVSRIARAVRALLAAHVIVVRSEAERELTRYLTGLALLAGAMMFAFSSAILFSVTLVVGVQRLTGLPLLESLVLCLAATLTLGSLLGLLAFLRLRRPLMPQSRELIRQTLDGLAPRA